MILLILLCILHYILYCSHHQPYHDNHSDHLDYRHHDPHPDHHDHLMFTRYASEFLQNVSVGRHRQCGDSQSNVIIEEFKDSREVMRMMVKIMIFDLITMVIMIMIAWRW